MFTEFKQFVPSEYCFQCKNCCVFESSVTPWRPLMGQEEKLRSCLHNSSDCFNGDRVHPDGYVKTEVEKNIGRCDVLTDQYMCQCYQSRPFECKLYPFVVVEKDARSYLAAHLSCPYVRDHLHDQDYHEYVDYLIRNFQTSELRLFLNRNRSIARTYGDDSSDLDIVYELEDDLSGITVSKKMKNVEDQLRETLKSFNIQLSAYAFPGIAVWEAFFSLDVKTIEDVLCIFASNATGTFLYTVPLTNNLSPKLVDKVFDIMENVNVSPGISRIENVPEKALPFFSEEKYRIAYKTREFIYRRDDIANYRGNAYKSKRSDYNHFVKHQNAQFVPYRREMAGGCLKLFERWVGQKGEEFDTEAQQMIDDARESHHMIFNDYEALGMIGRVVVVDGNIIAYTFGYPISNTDFCIFAEITDRDYKGLPCFIFREFCKDKEVLPFDRVNVMDAFGLPSLEATKISFRPLEALDVYSVYKK
ncbi:MAG: phosphatidylglycerol lysyltransferase domain-containing protein [Candidatus Omnitrophota bacterium]